jgi:hypothetical protein
VADPVLLASATEAAIARYCGDLSQPLEASRTMRCSPWLADMAPLCHEVLQPTCDNPPHHSPDQVRHLSVALDEELRRIAGEPESCDDWFLGEMGRLAALFAHAAARGDCIVRLPDDAAVRLP